MIIYSLLFQLIIKYFVICLIVILIQNSGFELKLRGFRVVFHPESKKDSIISNIIIFFINMI